MPSFINTNIAALNIQRNLNTSQASQNSALQRLSSGMRINSAKDDAAGMAITNRMSSQISGANQAVRNANDGISLAQTAEGDLTQISNNLQRMRDLTVQSSNATNTASDRAALSAEVQSLAQEIDRVAQNSSFNGVKLLDGSFTAQNFQVGANATANDSIAINAIGSARISQLGGVGTTTQATVVGVVPTAALVEGDLTLNGQQVGVTNVGALPGVSIASATSVATAINAVSQASGVTATANANTVAGAAATVFGAGTGTGAIAANTFSVNGINVGAIQGGGTAAGQGANVAAAINKISSQTGVTAAANATSGAVTLTAADGRDIAIKLNGTAVLGATAQTSKATFLTQTGLSTANVGIQGTTATLGAFTSLNSTNVADKLAITVDGSIVKASAALAAPYTAANFATDLNTFTTANTGYTVTDSTGTNVVGTVNATMVTAGIQLTKSDGTAVDIKITFSDTTGALAPVGTTSGGFAGMANGTVVAPASNITAALTNGTQNHGSVTLHSTSASGIVIGGASTSKAGLTAGATAATTVSSVSAISAIDISSATGATNALSAIDGAIAMVNTSRASLGAYQNRFASVVTSLQTTAENLTASRSRIQDTDFASETASLSRAQILQQAGTAMLAQANQLPNQVMSLLR